MNSTDNDLSNPGQTKEQSDRPSSHTINAGAEPQTLYALVARQPFLKGLSPRHLELLTECALQMQFAAGERIFGEGDWANRFYIILEGKVALESDGQDGASYPIQMLGPGDDLGWSWLFLPYNFHFSARAEEPTKVLFFYGTRLRQLCESDHELGFELMQRLGQVVVQRLEAMSRKLSEAKGIKRYRD